MDGKIVICFRDPQPGVGGSRGFLERARALDTRARVRGGTLVAWDGCRVGFAFDPDAIAEAIGLATDKGEDTQDGDARWCVGIAQGPLELLATDRGELAWGPALVVASTLAGAARPGELLCAPTVRACSDRALITVGSRVGRDGDLRVRGMRLDPICPLRKQALEQLTRMSTPLLVDAPLLREPVPAGSLVVLRADPGAGGTRWLTELASASPRSLVVSPSGSGLEPFGALRRAFQKTLSRELNPLLLELAEPLDALLGGEGTSLELAARLVCAFHWRKDEVEDPGLVVVDDAKAVDPASLEACVRAAQTPGAPFGIVARLDATSALPSSLATLSKVAEIAVTPLTREAAEVLAGGCTNDALDAVARKRWARLGGNVPLGIVEAVACGIANGELRWSGEEAAPRSRAAGRGKARSAAEWIAARVRYEPDATKRVLVAIALLGGEAKLSRVANVLEHAGWGHDVGGVVEELVSTRWLVETQEGWIGLPSRTHREALSTLLDDAARQEIHAAAADVIEQEEGALGRVEAGWHAAKSGDAKRASAILVAAAKATAERRLAATTTQILALARRIDPACEEIALELLSNALSGPSLAPPSQPTASHDSEPPTMIAGASPFASATKAPAMPLEAISSTPSEPPGLAGSDIASRLGELAKEALLAADNAALERWVESLHAAGESPVFTERMRAMARLGRGDIGDALRVLRRMRAQIDPLDHRSRCQTSLALAVALSVAGRSQDALLEALDALARARQAGDRRGASACIAFLAKLFASVGQTEQAARLKAAQA